MAKEVEDTLFKNLFKRKTQDNIVHSNEKIDAKDMEYQECLENYEIYLPIYINGLDKLYICDENVGVEENIKTILTIFIERTHEVTLFDNDRLDFIRMYLYKIGIVENILERKAIIEKITQTMEYQERLKNYYTYLDIYIEALDELSIYDENVSVEKTIQSILEKFIEITNEVDLFDNEFDNDRLDFIRMYLYKRGIVENILECKVIMDKIAQITDYQKCLKNYNLYLPRYMKDLDALPIYDENVSVEEIIKSILEIFIKITHEVNLFDNDRSDFIRMYLYKTGIVKNILENKVIKEKITQIKIKTAEEREEESESVREKISYNIEGGINNVKMYDSETRENYYGSLVLNENILVFVNNETKTEEFFSENMEIEVHRAIFDYGNNDILVSLNKTTQYILYGEDKEKNYRLILNHYKNYNSKIIERKLNFKNTVENKVLALLENDEITRLITNFIDYSSKDTFLDVKNFISLEHLIFLKYRIASRTTYSTLEQRTNVVQEYKANMELYNHANNYKTEYFDKLVKIIYKKAEFDSEEQCIFTTWRLLNALMIDYLHDYWVKSYGQYFEDVDNKSLKECCLDYCDADMITEDSVTNVGLFTYFLMKHKKFNSYKIDCNFIECNSIVIPLILEAIEDKKIREFEKKISKPKEKLIYSIDDIDIMTGHEFEGMIALIFSKMGYVTTVTKGSGDQGIDVIAKKNGVKIGIQAKCYSSKVSNSAIQEVVAGLKHYNCDKGIVVCNNYYTSSAQELAKSNEVILWDRDMLKRKIEEVLN